MKKLLSVVLLLMLFTLCFSLASCGGDDSVNDIEVSVDSVNSNALNVLMGALENTTHKFFASSEDNSAYAAITEALDKGALEIKFDGGELINSLIDMELKDAGATIYFDKASGKYAVTAGAKLDGTKVDGTVFVDKDGLKFMSESILGTKNTYALNLGSFIEKFENSALADLMGGVPDGMFGPYENYMNAFKTEYEKILTETEIQENSLINVLLKKLNPTVTEGDGTVILTYTLNNKTIEALMKAAVEEAAKIARLDAEIKNMLNNYVGQIVPMLNEMATIDLKAEFHLNTDDSTFAKQSIKGTMTVDGMAVSLDMTTTFSANEIKMTETMGMGGQNMTSSLSLTRTANGDDVTYKVVVKGSMNQGGQSMEFTACEIVAAYKANGNVSVKVSIPENMGLGNSNMTTYELIGKLDLTNGAKFTFTSIKMGDKTLIEGVSLTFNFIPGATAPAAGTVKDIVDLTEEELLAFEEMIANGALKNFIPSAKPDYSVSGY